MRRSRRKLIPNVTRREGNQEIDALPDEAVKKGDTWKRTEQMEFGNGQTFEFKKEYKYVGTEEVDGQTMDKISAKYLKVTYSVADNPQFALIKSDLKPTSWKETLLYDRELGSVTKTAREIRIQGDLTLSVGGMELDGKLDLKMKVGSNLEI